MSDPVRIPNLFGTVVEPPFVRAPELANLADDLIAECDEFEPIATAIREAGLVIEYVWETKPFDPLNDEYKPHVIAKVTKASPLWLSLASIHLVVQFRHWFWERFDDAQRRAVVHHELTHISLDEPDPQGRLPIKLRPHDVEDFNQTMRRYGPVIPGRAAFVRAAMSWAKANPDSPLLAPAAPPVSFADIAHAAGEAIADAVARGELGEDVSVRRDASRFGGLVHDDESLEQAYARIERQADFADVIGTDAGQRLLEELNRQRDIRRIVRRGGRQVDPETGEIIEGGES